MAPLGAVVGRDLRVSGFLSAAPAKRSTGGPTSVRLIPGANPGEDRAGLGEERRLGTGTDTGKNEKCVQSRTRAANEGRTKIKGKLQNGGRVSRTDYRGGGGGGRGRERANTLGREKLGAESSRGKRKRGMERGEERENNCGSARQAGSVIKNCYVRIADHSNGRRIYERGLMCSL